MTRTTRRAFTAASLLATPMLFLRGSSASAQLSEMPPTLRSEAEQIALDAYVYGYSLITTEVTRVQMSNVDKIEGMHAPTGQFANIKRYPPADFRGVSAPNADTLYSVAWLDLSEPQVFSHPDMGKRFYLFEMTDLWMTDFNSPGTRTAGGDAANYLITGPGWTGDVPAGMKQIKSATRYIVILGRTCADGADQDYAAVNALQAQYKIVPLSAYGKPYAYQMSPVNPNPGISMTRQSAVGDPRHGYLHLFQHDGAPDGRRGSSCARRRANVGPHGQDRSRSRTTVRHGKARSGDAGCPQGPWQDCTTAHRGEQGQLGRNGEGLGHD